LKPEPKTQLTITQNRFWIDAGAAGKKEQLWMVPVCVKAGGAKPFCQIISQKEQIVPVAGCTSWIFMNGNATGYYRSQYDKADFEKLKMVVATELNTAERMALVYDERALVASGEESMAILLDLISALKNDDERSVVESYLPTLERASRYLLKNSEADAFHAWVRSTFQPMLAKTGWTPAGAEKEDTHLLRADLIHILGIEGKDPEVIRQSTTLAQQYLKDPGAVDPTIAKSVLDVAATFGDEPLFKQYMEALQRLRSPEQYYNVGGALSHFRDPTIVQQVLELSVSDKTRNQDAAALIAGLLVNPDNQKVAWDWVKAHWAEVEKKTTVASGAGIVNATRGFCSVEMRDDVQNFFAEHKVAATERVLKQSYEAISACAKSLPRLQSELGGWLQQHGMAKAGN
jgi:aminopeptidase N